MLTFPAGSAGGPDGLRPQHIRDMLLSREGGSELLSALTAFVNMVLAGRCPKDVAPVFFGGRLLALNKKSGGIRPIVVGFSLRRLVSKCATSFGTKHLTDFFHPHQLGVGIPGGCKAAIHSAHLKTCGYGKHVGSLFVGCVLYADDIVLLSFGAI